MKKYISILALPLLVMGCTTSTYVKLPENSVLKIKRGTEVPHSSGKLVSAPFSWSSAGGIPYKIEKNGEVIKTGSMRAKFRAASIFWPPVAILYWPIGFREACYDLTGDVASQCSVDTLKELKSQSHKK